jgi:hypothetical protein
VCSDVLLAAERSVRLVVHVGVVGDAQRLLLAIHFDENYSPFLLLTTIEAAA